MYKLPLMVEANNKIANKIPVHPIPKYTTSSSDALSRTIPDTNNYDINTPINNIDLHLIL